MSMAKKLRTTFSNKENRSPRGNENSVSLNSTDDTDIIECSIIDENKQNFIKKGKYSFKKPSGIESPGTPSQFKELQNSNDSVRNSNKALRLSLRKSYGLSDTEENADLCLQTPHPCKNVVVQKLISSLKKTPEAPQLSKSKLRNIEKWLNENEVEVVRTPPFANLSVTPITSLKKKRNQWKDRDKNLDESSLDSEVEGVLKAVYGDDWKVRAKTEPKKKPKRHFSPASKTAKKAAEDFRSVRRNILGGRKLNLVDSDDEENCLNDSVLSGVKMINLDSSGCSYEPPKTSVKINLEKRKLKAESVESIQISPREKKMFKTTADGGESKKSTGKKEVVSKTPKKTFLASLSVSTPTSRCHPEAQSYKLNFKSKKEELVKKLYKLYNGEVFCDKLPEDMNFSWNVKLRGTAGYCYNKRITKSTGEIIRLSRVEFSTKIVDRADRLRDTMIHELCHAASWVIDGVLDGHGEVWGKWASRAMERFPELPKIKRCHNYEIVSKYVYRCTGCGYSIKRHSKSINTERKRCGHCYGVLELLINKKKKGKGEVPQFDTTRTLPTPNKFAMFVKENYHTVKSNNTNAKHSEIMKKLSQQYALIKNGTKSAGKVQAE